MEEIDYREIQHVLDDLLGNEFDFQKMAEKGASGDKILSLEQIADILQKVFLEELILQKELWIHILILSVAAAVLVHFADVFQNKNVSQISFCMIYMLLFMILITSFQSSMEITKTVLSGMRQFMTVLAPAFFLALTLTSYLTSAGIYYEFILLLISGVGWMADRFVLPCIEIYVLFVLVNHLSKESRLERLTELIGMLVGWVLKASLALVTGFHMIQGVISPAADAFRRTGVNKGLEMVPGVGDMSSSVTEMVLGSAMLIKNGIGAATLVALIFLCLVPLVKLGMIMVAYYVLAAVLQPVSDERITACLGGMGTGVKLLFQTVFTVLALFLLTIALITAATG